MLFDDIPEPVLITGAGGFIGSHLVDLCLDLGISVKAFFRYSSTSSLGWLYNNKNTFEKIFGDIRDLSSVVRGMRGCKSVIHLGALISIPYSYQDPKSYIDTNIIGTYNILEGARVSKLERLVISSTSETYGTAQYTPIDEKHPINSQSPYAASKAAADQLALSYHRSFGVPVSIARPFNTYGPRQSTRAIIPSVIRQLLKASKVFVGNTHTTRDFTYVTDTARGLLSILNSKNLVGTCTNIGTNAEISIEELILKIACIIGKEPEIFVDESKKRPALSEVDQLWCNNNKIINTTLWKPEVSLSLGLEKTIQFVKENAAMYEFEAI
jgi:NAD dependent epimerase/dehydratase